LIENARPNIAIYVSKDKKTQIEINLDEDTVWASEYDLTVLFGKSRRTVGYHISNIYAEGELDKKSTWRKFRQVQKEGNRKVVRETSSYNLDLIISVGFRVKSHEGILFRKWANQVIKDHLINGYSLNHKRLKETEKEIKFLRSGIQIVSRAIEEKANEEGFEYLNQFAKGLTLLDDYDRENLDARGLTERKAIYPLKEEYQALIDQMKQEFDSAVFGFEKDQSFKSAVAQISKGFEEADFYPSIEEKAATLLYLHS